MENLLSAVQEERKNYGDTMSDDECATLCNAVAWKYRETGWGVSGKTAGTRGVLPNGVEIASDILHHKPTNVIIDVLVAAGASSVPTWNVLGVQSNLKDRPWVAPTDPAKFAPPVRVVSPVVPAPPVATPVASVTPNDIEQILSALKTLSADVSSLEKRLSVGAEASVRTEKRFQEGIPVRIKTLIGKIVGVVGGN